MTESTPPTPEPMTGERARCGMPCLKHHHDCDRSPRHTGFHRDVQQKGDHTCEWDTPGPQDIPALIAALAKSRRGGKELGKTFVYLAELVKAAFVKGENDPIGALHMLGDHLANLFEDEGGLSTDDHNRVYRALEQRRDEVERLRAELDSEYQTAKAERTELRREVADMKAGRDRIAEQVRALAENLEATMRLWSGEEPEGPNGCDAVDEHNCHRVAGEMVFNEAIRQVRAITGGGS